MSSSQVEIFPASEPQSALVYAQILEEIESQKLLPGERLREAELAQRLKVSRTPIREALRLLELEGVISHLPRQGATIRKLRYAEIMELYDMRLVLESAVARFAARSASKLELHHLEQLNVEFSQARKSKERARLNSRFHHAMMHAAKNQYLAQSLNILRKTLLLLGSTTLSDEERHHQAIVEHQAILEAIARQDQNAAETYMRKHIEAAQKARIHIALDEDLK